MDEFTPELQKFIDGIESYITKEVRGRIGYRTTKPTGHITMNKFDDDAHRNFLAFVHGRGYSIGMYFAGIEKWVQSKSSEPIPNVVEIAKDRMKPHLGASKEDVMTWGKSLSVGEQKQMEEHYFWGLKIFKALTQGEKDLGNWDYLARKY